MYIVSRTWIEQTYLITRDQLSRAYVVLQNHCMLRFSPFDILAEKMSGWQFPQWNYGYTQMPGYYLAPPHAGAAPGMVGRLFSPDNSDLRVCMRTKYLIHLPFLDQFFPQVGSRPAFTAPLPSVPHPSSSSTVKPPVVRPPLPPGPRKVSN